MHRVCRDPLLPFQACLWPPDVLLWEIFQIPKISRKHQHQNCVALGMVNIDLLVPLPVFALDLLHKLMADDLLGTLKTDCFFFGR
jgi:hypothetical protein